MTDRQPPILPRTGIGTDVHAFAPADNVLVSGHLYKQAAAYIGAGHLFDGEVRWR